MIAGIMEHIEEAGIHSGDSACSLPAHTLSDSIVKKLEETMRRQVETVSAACVRLHPCQDSRQERIIKLSGSENCKAVLQEINRNYRVSSGCGIVPDACLLFHRPRNISSHAMTIGASERLKRK